MQLSSVVVLFPYFGNNVRVVKALHPLTNTTDKGTVALLFEMVQTSGTTTSLTLGNGSFDSNIGKSSL